MSKVDMWDLTMSVIDGKADSNLVMNNNVFVAVLDNYAKFYETNLVDALNHLTDDLNLSPADVKGLLDQHTTDRIEVDARKLHLLKGKNKTRKLT